MVRRDERLDDLDKSINENRTGSVSHLDRDMSATGDSLGPEVVYSKAIDTGDVGLALSGEILSSSEEVEGLAGMGRSNLNVSKVGNSIDMKVGGMEDLNGRVVMEDITKIGDSGSGKSGSLIETCGLLPDLNISNPRSDSRDSVLDLS
ncbi:hypothetical protein Dimus_005824 [Dionaea muscipula]